MIVPQCLLVYQVKRLGGLLGDADELDVIFGEELYPLLITDMSDVSFIAATSDQYRIVVNGTLRDDINSS